MKINDRVPPSFKTTPPILPTPPYLCKKSELLPLFGKILKTPLYKGGSIYENAATDIHTEHQEALPL